MLFLRVLIELFCSLAFFLSLKQPLLLLYGIGHGFNFNFCTDTHTSNLLVSLLLGLPYRAPALALNHIFFFFFCGSPILRPPSTFICLLAHWKVLGVRVRIA